MSLVRIQIDLGELGATLDNIENIILCDYDYIEVYEAETKYGSYTKITDGNTRIIICKDQVIYDFDYSNGSEYNFYKWNLINNSGSNVSKYSEPIQAYTPNTTYCKFEEVKRLLRSKNYEGTIRFSDNYKNLRNNNSNIKLNELNFSPDYSGTSPFKITFSDSTNFIVEVGDESSIEKRNIGSGDINTDFISNDGFLRINSTDWTGTATAGDYIEFDSDSHMSISDAIKFVKDAEILVDVILEENLRYKNSNENSLRFTRTTVPKSVSAATSRFAAFFIYTTIYSEQNITGLPSNINDITTSLISRENDLSSWVKQAMRYLTGYINKYTQFFDPDSGELVSTGPRWINTDTLFDSSGVHNVGEGLKKPDKNIFFDKANMSYMGLLDHDLIGLLYNDILSL